MMSVALSADGQVAASGGMDGAVRLWEAGRTKQMLRPDRPYERMDITDMTGTTAAQAGRAQTHWEQWCAAIRRIAMRYTFPRYSLCNELLGGRTHATI